MEQSGWIFERVAAVLVSVSADRQHHDALRSGRLRASEAFIQVSPCARSRRSRSRRTTDVRLSPGAGRNRYGEPPASAMHRRLPPLFAHGRRRHHPDHPPAVPGPREKNPSSPKKPAPDETEAGGSGALVTTSDRAQHGHPKQGVPARPSPRLTASAHCHDCAGRRPLPAALTTSRAPVPGGADLATPATPATRASIMARRWRRMGEGWSRGAVSSNPASRTTPLPACPSPSGTPTASDPFGSGLLLRLRRVPGDLPQRLLNVEPGEGLTTRSPPRRVAP